MGDATIRCAGSNILGNLGAGHMRFEPNVVTVSGLPPSKEVHDLARGSSTCALSVGGEVWCWGENSDGQLGSAPEESPVCGFTHSRDIRCNVSPRQVLGLPPAAQLIAGENRFCVVGLDREVVCWGGLGPTGEVRHRPQQTTTLPESSSLYLYYDRIVTLHSRTRIESELHVPLPPISETDRVRIGPGASACTIAASGRVRCIRITDSSMGHAGSTEEEGPTCALDVSVGEGHSCAVLTNGLVSCWGYNWSGALGTQPISNVESVPSYQSPRIVPQIDRVISVKVILSSSCALRDDGSVWCWGLAGAHANIPTRMQW
jgi:alpha-tubulin suppressor-like RCC1 family protein